MNFEIRKDGFYLDGEKFYLISGDIHYFRIHPSDWEKRILLAKDFGLTAIQTYMPWNLHEARKGEFDFSGILDFEVFLSLAHKHGLKVLLRPSPYICSECDYGGLPAWLNKENIPIRSCDERYLRHVREYYDVLIPKILPYLCTKGGPVIMVAIENEYGVVANDKAYLTELKNMLTERGIDVPLYTTDNEPPYMDFGSLPGILRGWNFRGTRGEGGKMYEYYKNGYDDFPFFAGEFWAGRSINWLAHYEPRDPRDCADAFAECLRLGYVNLYMFSGGTNFGFFSGAVWGRGYGNSLPAGQYLLHSTSYDVDAPVGENGLPTEKYYLMRAELDKFLGKEVRKDRTLPFEYKTQTPEIKLTKCARLFDNLDALTEQKSNFATVKTMEECDQCFGFILYSAEVNTGKDMGEVPLEILGLQGAATVYADEKYIGFRMRDAEAEPISFSLTDKGTKISVLAENTGRRNCGGNIELERGGIKGQIVINQFQTALHGIEHRTLPMSDLSKIEWKELDRSEIAAKDPVFYKGSFNAESGADTYIDMSGFGSGFVMINGFNIGRYRECGPQKALYVPGGLLLDGENTIEIFDVMPKGKISSVKTRETMLWENKV